MKPLSKAQQATLSKNRGIDVERGLQMLNARGRIIQPKASLLAIAIANSIGKRHV